MTRLKGSCEHGFEVFRDRYKPHIRPQGMIARTHTALQLGGEFARRFTLIRRQVREQIQTWPERIGLFLLSDPTVGDRIGEDEISLLRRLADAHLESLMNARFDEAYFSTLEDNALFYLFLAVPHATVLGAIKDANMRSIEALYDSHAPAHKRMALMTMVDLLMLEMNQTQRVFILYDQIRAGESGADHLADVVGGS
ncbi:MAG: hypothetical protein AAFR17_05365 [Pseudomonadota bacterium]